MSYKIEKNKNSGLAVFLIIVFGLLSRLIPHPPNFSPINSVFLFSSLKLKKRNAILIPLLIMFISDVFLGLHSTMFFVYGSFIITYILGHYFKEKINIFTLFFLSLTSSIIFFVITNFGVFLLFNMYPHSIKGLLDCYLMALPFFQNTFFSDLFYNYSFYIGFKFLNSYILRKTNNWGML